MNTKTQVDRKSNKDTRWQKVKQRHKKLEKRGVTQVTKSTFKIERQQYTQNSALKTAEM